MYIPFEQMPDTARIWIYQINRALSDAEVRFVAENTERFLAQWQAHGQDLSASYRVEHNQFLVLTVDESSSQASGCSIDSSVHLIQALERELGVSFMTTSQVAFLVGDEINLFPFNELKNQVTNQVIKPETKVFDNTVKNLADFKKKWLVNSEHTWVNRYFK